MISNTCKYGLRAVVYLAANEDINKRVGIKQISSDLKIPMPFLGKILQSLARTKLLASTKGPNGGFSLGRKASEISLLDVIEAIDGLDFFNECVIGFKVCENDIEHQKICPMHNKLENVRLQFYNLFKEQKVGDLANDVTTLNKILNLKLIP